MQKLLIKYQSIILYGAIIVLMLAVLAAATFFVTFKMHEQSFHTLNDAYSNQLLQEFNAFYAKKTITLNSLTSNGTLRQFVKSLEYINIHNGVQSNDGFKDVVSILRDAEGLDEDIYAVSLAIYNKNAIIYQTGDVYHFLATTVPPSALETHNDIIISSTYYDVHSADPIISIKSYIYNDDGNAVAEVSLNVKVSNLDEILSLKADPNVQILYFNTPDTLFYANHNTDIKWHNLSDLDTSLLEPLLSASESIEASSFNASLNDIDYTWHYFYLPDIQMYAAYGFKLKPLYNQVFTTATFIILSGFALILIFVIWNAQNTLKIEKQFQRLSQSMIAAGNGIFAYETIPNRPLHIQQLFESYNTMLRALSELSIEISSISKGIHQYATALNEDAEINNRAIQQIAHGVMSITSDTMDAVDSIESLDTLTKSIDHKLDRIDRAFSNIENMDYKTLSEDAIQIELKTVLAELNADVDYLRARKVDILQFLSLLTKASKQNAYVARSIKGSIDQQRDSTKNMSRVITNLYRSSLNLNNSLNRLSVKPLPQSEHSKKHPS